jgi:rubrerythrin
MNQPTQPGALAVPSTLDEFMAQALVMELDAAQRYNEFADMMETHNNPEVADWFRKMAVIESKHATKIMSEMGWKEAPAHTATPVLEGFESPESAPVDDMHYLMRPWHVLQLALANEERAERFFAHLAAVAQVESVREAALELQQEEHEHVKLVKAWMQKVPRPESNWDHDPDPPHYDD